MSQITSERLDALIVAWKAISDSYKDGTEDMLTALTELRALRAQLAGRVIVPREPTYQMKEAGWYASKYKITGDVAESVWNAMLSASPNSAPACRGGNVITTPSQEGPGHEGRQAAEPRSGKERRVMVKNPFLRIDSRGYDRRQRTGTAADRGMLITNTAPMLDNDARLADRKDQR